jgi:hypothetical protein
VYEPAVVVVTGIIIVFRASMTVSYLFSLFITGDGVPYLFELLFSLLACP